MMSDLFSSLEFTLSHAPEEILQAVDDQFGPGQSLPPILNWELLADTAHNRGALGFRDHFSKKAEAWTCLAIKIYDKLASGGVEWQRGHFQRNSMFSRANLISQLGPDESDPHLSAAAIERWFFAVLPCSLSELRILCKAAEAGDADAMGLVLEVKANLAVLRLLLGKVSFSREAEIRELLEMKM